MKKENTKQAEQFKAIESKKEIKIIKKKIETIEKEIKRIDEIINANPVRVYRTSRDQIE